ncbi:kwg repeat protein [Gloeomargarita lithophora Alchichica-D10]|uniref:Kwg repeat protein n=1 Tax=Gloeomargarita lithophora Alchichica-D10 TaxID=1188229 RepID=A0A1J0ACM2_9CYAN|nr:WG repeat-containing protein [Gloeomargarita lithophora]APB33664.1 kwg repeat protein [Gloeomargarita lithophora Alchichica-D10]
MIKFGLKIGLTGILALGLTGCGLLDTIRGYVRSQPQEQAIETPTAFVPTGTEAIPPQFAFVGEFDDTGLAPAAVPDPQNKDRRLWGFINTQGEMVIAPQFQCEYGEDEIPCGPFVDGIARVVRERKTGDKPEDSIIEFGFINRTGTFIAPPQFIYANDFSDGLAAVTVGKDFQAAKVGYLNAQGELAIQPQFLSAGSFQQGYAPACQGPDYERAKCGVIDKTGKFVVPPKYDWIDMNGYQNGLLKVMLNEKWGFIR